MYLMHYLYVIMSYRDRRFYIGVTSDLAKRINEHNTGKFKAWTNNRKWKLVYYEAYLNRRYPEKRERIIKRSGSVRTHLIKRIKESLVAW